MKSRFVFPAWASRRAVLRLVVAVLLSSVCRFQAEGRVAHLLPRPQVVDVRSGERPFALSGEASLDDPTGCALLAEVLTEYGLHLSAKAKRRVVVTLAADIAGSRDPVLAGFDSECYRLDVSERLIAIEAVSAVGVLRAAQTLRQLAEGYRHGAVVEAVTIVDWPAFKLRGFLHDTGTNFIPVDELKRQLRLLSRFKVNTFRWRLSGAGGWRFEVASYPQLASRDGAGGSSGFYSQEECREVEALARELGIVVIPEVDLCCAAFERELGLSLDSDRWLRVARSVLSELAGAFPQAPYLHVGGFVESGGDTGRAIPLPSGGAWAALHDWVRALGRRMTLWSSAAEGCAQADMVELCADGVGPIDSRVVVDCRHSRLDRFDLFADVAAAYLWRCCGVEHGTERDAGVVASVWGGHVQDDVACLLRENNFYAGVLALTSRAWQGGGARVGCCVNADFGLRDDFAEWEGRFLFHKAHSLAGEPVAYVRQSHLEWAVTVGGREYKIWGAGVPVGPASWGGGEGLLAAADDGEVASVRTRVYSPAEQKVGALIEFQSYSRSDADSVPEYGRWDFRGSRVWLNGVEVLAPVWRHHGQRVELSVALADENVSARGPAVLHLDEGWNEVRMELPYARVAGVRRSRWMFAFAFTDPEGRYALDLDCDTRGECGE